MRQSGISHQLEIIIGGISGRKKTSPWNRHAGFYKGFGDLRAVIITGVESGIGYKNIFSAGILQFAGVAGYFTRREKPHPGAFNVGISAVSAMKRTTSFCLQVEHAAVGQIKLRV